MRQSIKRLRVLLLESGQEVETQKWQGKDNHPKFLELLHATAMIPMAQNIEDMKQEAQPMLPWADIHFDERVGGEPLNPPPSHKLWLRGNEEYMSGTKFSHSYPERFWSKTLHNGIRYDIGDLGDLIQLLIKEPDTRQAYLPIYFPEDIFAARSGERIPCTLGYHFIVRNGKLDLFYPMRSCDVIRHMHNDLYLANRLALFVKEQAHLKDIKLGNIHFVATSLHCFTSDRIAIEKAIKCAE
ncbi:thymidylate synthase [Sulfurimonas sp.]|uniref:thymidylate synthase n=1 Tax=Sulfurimonas sp. TaxID=2022749 RepID=UPI003563BD4B